MRLRESAIVVAAGYHTVAVESNRTVWAWGQNDSGQVGDGTLTDRLAPVQVVGLSKVMVVDAGNGHTVALGGDDGTVWTWGLNDSGQLGDGVTTDRSRPVQLKRF